VYNVNYLTENPLEGQCPKVFIKDDTEHIVNFYDNKELIKSIKTNGNEFVYGDRQWFTNWKVEIIKDNKIVYTDIFNLKDKVVFIKSDAWALGDNIAWMPYVEEFRKKHKCKVICSTFFNYFFEEYYKDIMFVEPNIRIGNVYAQYYIGVDKDKDNFKYCPSTYPKSILQKTACDILGLEYKEIVPNTINLETKTNIEKYICISEHSSNLIKNWNLENGWQEVVNYLNMKGYKVVVISKEETKLKGIVDKTGNYPLIERMYDLKNASMFIGVSSGLAWLSWMVGTHVAMISDYTPPYHEFKSNMTRIYSKNCRQEIIKKELDSQVPLNVVIDKLEDYFNEIKLS